MNTTTNINIPPMPSFPSNNMFNNTNPLASTLLNAVAPNMSGMNNYNQMTEAQNLINSGITANTVKDLQNKVEELTKELNMKRTREAEDVERILITSEEGRILMQVRDNQIMKLLIEQALITPSISSRAKAIMEKYTEESKKIIDKIKASEEDKPVKQEPKSLIDVGMNHKKGV